MKIGIASDHHGVNKKKKLIKYLEKRGHNVINYGTDTINSVDYPDYAFTVGERINSGEIELGILICGNGIGMSIAANKVANIRCAKVDNIKEAEMSKSHNDANIIAISSTMSLMKMKDIIDKFIKIPFSKIERHQRRVDKINKYRGNYEF